MSRCAVRVRRWCSCTVSPRRDGCGDLSGTCWRNRALCGDDLPGHAESGSVRADLPTTASLVAEAVRTQIGDEPCALLGYSLGGPVALHAAIAADLPLSHVVFIGVTAGIGTRPDVRVAASPTRSSQTTWKLPGTSRASLTHGCAARCSTGWNRKARHKGPSASATARPAWLPALVFAERAARPRCGIASELALPVLALAGSDDNRFAVHALRLARLVPSGIASPSLVEAMPCAWPNPNRPAGSCVTGSTRSGRARPEGMKPATSKQQTDCEERARNDLEPRRRPQASARGRAPPRHRAPGRGGDGRRDRQQR